MCFFLFSKNVLGLVLSKNIILIFILVNSFIAYNEKFSFSIYSWAETSGVVFVFHIKHIQ